MHRHDSPCAVRRSVPPRIALTTLAFCLLLPGPARLAGAAEPAGRWSSESEARLRLENRTNPGFDAGRANDTDAVLGRLRLGLRWRDSAGWSLLVQPQLTYGRIRSGRTDSTLDARLYQLHFDLTERGARWRIGRQVISLGDQRLMGPGNWGNSGRSWDGLRVTSARKSATTDLFVARLGHVASKPSDPTLLGLYSTVSLGRGSGSDLYAILKRERAGTTREVWTLGVRPHGSLGGGLKGTLETALQAGHSGSRDVSAFAYAATLAYAPPGAPGLSVALVRSYASGGDPTGGGAVHTFDQLYASNHQRYGYMDLVGWRNMREWALSVAGRPRADLELVAELHWFGLADARDYWYGDGGSPVKGASGAALRDPSGLSGRDLGREIDLVATWTPLPGLEVSGGWGRFMPGAFVRRVNGGHADAMDWVFVQSAYGF